MQNHNLSRYLTARTEDLRSDLNAASTVHGDLSWLFVPEQPRGKVCLVAHIDTVHPEDWKTKHLIHDNGIIRSPQGLGADDRAGVWSAMELFYSMPAGLQPYVLLTDQEEMGGIGAREAANLFSDRLRSTDITYFIELDRKGSEDAVFYNGEPAAFRHYVKSFGFRENRGSFSDISILGPAAGKCCVNLSTGYYNSRTNEEFLRVPELLTTAAKVRAMLADNSLTMTTWATEAAAAPASKRKTRTHVCARGGELR